MRASDAMLSVSETGPRDAPPIVFLHGGGTRGWSWAPVTARLPEFRCLVPDLPGHGASHNAGRFTMASATDQVAAVIRARTDRPVCCIVGLSLGAQLTLQLLATAPEIVGRALVSGTLTRPVPFSGAAIMMGRSFLPLRNVGWLVRANMRALRVPGDYLADFTEDTRQLTADLFSDIMRANMRFRPPPALRGVRTPVLVAVGQHERAILRRSAQDLCAVLPNARGVVVEGVSHNWCLEAPARFAELVRAWATDAPLPPGLSPLA